MQPSDSVLPKRTRAKTEGNSAKSAITVKKPRVHRTTAAAGPEGSVAQATAISSVPQWSQEQFISMVATAAYFLAEERGFSPGHELDDWLEAERRIRQRCVGA